VNEETFSTLDIVTLMVAGWGAVLSTVMAALAIRRGRRRLKIRVSAGIWVWPESRDHFLVEVLAVNDGHRPIEVNRALTRTAGGALFYPMLVDNLDVMGSDARSAPVVLQDGESVPFYWDGASFNLDDYFPRAVIVETTGGTRYTKRITRKERRQIESIVVDAHRYADDEK
jgi:hypothetical protein